MGVGTLATDSVTTWLTGLGMNALAGWLGSPGRPRAIGTPKAAAQDHLQGRPLGMASLVESMVLWSPMLRG